MQLNWQKPFDMKILVIDNYDSFVYNIVYMLYELGINDLTIVKNDKVEIKEIEDYDGIILSPGPGIPASAGKMPRIIREFAPTKKMLGVCLGHQAIGEAFGGKLINLKEPMHGLKTKIQIKKQDTLFDGLPNNFEIGHYHSWILDENLPAVLEVLARDGNGNVAAIRHSKYALWGVQFHPESVLTQFGKNLIKNWLIA
jgi:anthranilate synthase component II